MVVAGAIVEWVGEMIWSGDVDVSVVGMTWNGDGSVLVMMVAEKVMDDNDDFLVAEVE